MGVEPTQGQQKENQMRHLKNSAGVEPTTTCPLGIGIISRCHLTSAICLFSNFHVTKHPHNCYMAKQPAETSALIKPLPCEKATMPLFHGTSDQAAVTSGLVGPLRSWKSHTQLLYGIIAAVVCKSMWQLPYGKTLTPLNLKITLLTFN